MSEKQYRVVRNTYSNRIEFEDGPGSLQNIVSDVSKKVLHEWNEPSDTPINEVTRYAQRCVPYSYGDDDPRIECSYRLESRDCDNTEWRFVDSLFPLVVRDTSDDFEDHRWDYLEDRDDEEE